MSDYECKPAGEDEAIDEILRLTMEQLNLQNPPGQKPVMRDAHAKHHGLVHGELEVHANLPPELARGVFQAPRKFKALVRFSNSVGHVGDDHEPQTRGMAIKLLGVEGEKLLEDERNETTQDFVMLSHPVFPVADVFEYIEFMNAVFSGKPVWFFLNSFNPLKWRTRAFSIVNGMRGKKVSNPLTTQFFSATPFLLGDRAIQFSLRPTKTTPEPIGDSPNYLREAMARTLDAEDVAFEFLMKFQSADKEPIEDPRIEWTASWQLVGTLRIPKQSFQSSKRMELAENLSFTPWHSLPEHRPLGGINRARKKIYLEISKHRQEQNGVPRKEPTEHDDLG